MKFTSEDLMKAMGLSVGDRIKVNNNAMITIFEVTNDYGLFRIDNVVIPNARTGYELHDIFGLYFEILPRPKRVGETLCEDCECVECHLRCLPHCNQLNYAQKTLFNILEEWNAYHTFDQEIYDLLKARLDKEVLGDDK